jgi:hypothetical protein
MWRFVRPGRGVLVAALAFLALPLAGCGPRFYPVRGTVTLEDGTPLDQGLVVFERVEGGPPVTARGNVGPDGRFELSTEKPGDGVPPGRYRVLVNPLDPSDLPDEQKKLPFDNRYMRFETSGLEYEVPGAGAEYAIKLDRPRKKK